jgi:hypothetical protein
MTPQEAIEIVNLNLVDNDDPEISEALEILEAMTKQV